MFATGLDATSRVDAVWQGYLTSGIGAGRGGGLFASSLFAISAGWFDRHRGTAQGIVATGSGVGTLVLLPVAERIIDQRALASGLRAAVSAVGATILLGLRQEPVELTLTTG